MFYRSGWLRCVGLKYVVFDSSFVFVLAFERLVLDYSYYYYYILYYTLLLLCSLLSYPSSSILLSYTLPPFPNHHSKYTCRCLLLDTYISSMFMFCSSSSQYSFYTCRVFHLLIYIQSIYLSRV